MHHGVGYTNDMSFSVILKLRRVVRHDRRRSVVWRLELEGRDGK